MVASSLREVGVNEAKKSKGVFRQNDLHKECMDHE